jgi:hypothetical protein
VMTPTDDHEIVLRVVAVVVVDVVDGQVCVRAALLARVPSSVECDPAGCLVAGGLVRGAGSFRLAGSFELVPCFVLRPARCAPAFACADWDQRSAR